ncbi:MAG: hypothetical protein JO072_10770 [Parafilimonas sp.]|nr:hypothetical protein [Parafilimonas sp.]
MRSKPISPFVHGIIDYAFALSLLSVPSIIKLNKKVRLLYALNAVSILSYSAFTKYPVAIKQVIPFRFHKILDIDSLSALLLQGAYKKIRRDRYALSFHGIMLAAGVITVLLTNWNEAA